MERLYDITRQPPETEHEKWFQKTYGKAIEDALQCLKNPTNPSRPQTSWLPFKQVIGYMLVTLVYANIGDSHGAMYFWLVSCIFQIYPGSCDHLSHNFLFLELRLTWESTFSLWLCPKSRIITLNHLKQ